MVVLVISITIVAVIVIVIEVGVLLCSLRRLRFPKTKIKKQVSIIPSVNSVNTKKDRELSTEEENQFVKEIKE